MNMKRIYKSLLGLHGLILLGSVLLSMQATAQEAAVLQGDTERLSYAMGVDLGQQLHRLSVEVKPELFARGLQDGISGGKTLMSHEEALTLITSLQDELHRREKARAMLQQPQTGQTTEPAQR